MKSVYTTCLDSEILYFSIYYAFTHYCLFIQLSYFWLGSYLDEAERRSFAFFSLDSFPKVNNCSNFKWFFSWLIDILLKNIRIFFFFFYRIILFLFFFFFFLICSEFCHTLKWKGLGSNVQIEGRNLATSFLKSYFQRPQENAIIYLVHSIETI